VGVCGQRFRWRKSRPPSIGISIPPNDGVEGGEGAEGVSRANIWKTLNNFFFQRCARENQDLDPSQTELRGGRETSVWSGGSSKTSVAGARSGFSGKTSERECVDEWSIYLQRHQSAQETDVRMRVPIVLVAKPLSDELRRQSLQSKRKNPIRVR